MRTTAASALIAALFGATTAFGQTPQKAPLQAVEFKTLDRNSDGFISAKEAETAGALHDVFAALDTNQDGRLSPIEFAAWPGADKSKTPTPASPGTAPSGSGGAQHMPEPKT